MKLLSKCYTCDRIHRDEPGVLTRVDAESVLACQVNFCSHQREFELCDLRQPEGFLLVQRPDDQRQLLIHHHSRRLILPPNDTFTMPNQAKSNKPSAGKTGGTGKTRTAIDDVVAREYTIHLHKRVRSV